MGEAEKIVAEKEVSMRSIRRLLIRRMIQAGFIFLLGGALLNVIIIGNIALCVIVVAFVLVVVWRTLINKNIIVITA